MSAPHPTARAVAVPVLAGVVVGLACAVAVLVGGLSGWPHAPALASFLVAGAGMSGGVLVLVRSGPADARACRRWFGLAALAWCGGELVSVLIDVALAGPPPRPNVGDAVSLCAGPLALLGVLRLPRPRGHGASLRTLSVDAVVLALGLSVAAWMAFFPAETGQPLLVVFCVCVVLLYLLLCSLIAQVAMVGRDPGVVVLLVGLSALAVGDLAVTRELVAGAAVWAWPLAAALCFSWPVILGGVDAIGRHAPGRRRRAATTDEGDTYASVVTTAAVYVVWLAALAILVARGAGVVTVVLGLLAVSSAGAREVLRLRSRLRAVRRLAHEANHDALTGLPNARALASRVDDLVADGAAASLVVVDLDAFADVNDRFGSAGGDEVLVAVGTALEERVGDRVHRLDGDRYAVVTTTGIDEAAVLAEALRGAVAAAVRHGDGCPRTTVTASCGVAGIALADDELGPAGTVPDARSVVAEASTAVQAAKRAGGDQVALFRGEVAERVRRRALVERRLRHAVEAGDLQVHLQPLVHIGSGRLKGFEVLARWEDPVLGRVDPEEFVDVAEQSGLVGHVGQLALVRGLAAFRESGALQRGLTLSVNASPVELRDPGYSAAVARALAEAGVPATSLVIEVTETVLVADQDPAVPTMHALSDGGVCLAVDDFGSGYSSLTYLSRLPVDVVKIDRSLVVAMGDPRADQVLEALVRLSRALDLLVVAEGVEEQEQVGPLHAMGVDVGQGWLWSRSLPVEQVAAAVAADLAAHPGPPPWRPDRPADRPPRGPGRQEAQRSAPTRVPQQRDALPGVRALPRA